MTYKSSSGELKYFELRYFRKLHAFLTHIRIEKVHMRMYATIPKDGADLFVALLIKFIRCANIFRYLTIGRWKLKFQIIPIFMFLSFQIDSFLLNGFNVVTLQTRSNLKTKLYRVNQFSLYTFFTISSFADLALHFSCDFNFSFIHF